LKFNPQFLVLKNINTVKISYLIEFGGFDREKGWDFTCSHSWMFDVNGLCFCWSVLKLSVIRDIWTLNAVSSPEFKSLTCVFAVFSVI